MTKYPFLRSSSFLGEPAGECAACASPATHSVRIAGDYMRGNDDFYVVCSRHFKMSSTNTSRFVAHFLTKDKFVKRSGGMKERG